MFYKWLPERKNLNILTKPYLNPLAKFSCKTCKCLYYVFVLYKIFHLTNKFL